MFTFRGFFGPVDPTPDQQAELEKSPKPPSATGSPTVVQPGSSASAKGATPQGECPKKRPSDQGDNMLLNTPSGSLDVNGRADSSSIGGSFLSRASEQTMRSMEVNLGESCTYLTLSFSMCHLCRHRERRYEGPKEVHEDDCPLYEHTR